MKKKGSLNQDRRFKRISVMKLHKISKKKKKKRGLFNPTPVFRCVKLVKKEAHKFISYKNRLYKTKDA